MQPKKYVKRVLLSLLIFVLSFCVLSMMITMVFFYTAFPRSDGVVADVSYSDGLSAEPIRFPSGANMLSGYHYTCPDPRALVVIAAGFRESGTVFLPEIKRLNDSGFDVLCYDATGVGKSEGSSTVGLSQPAIDLRSALDYIAEDSRLSQLPVLLYGHSAGGYAAASCLDHDSVQAAVILCGFESPTLLMRETARSYVGILADIEYPFLWMGSTLLFSADGDKSASKSIEASDIPVAVYEALDDEVIPRSVRLSSYLDAGSSNLTLRYLDEAHGGHSGFRLSDTADSSVIDSLIVFYDTNIQ